MGLIDELQVKTDSQILSKDLEKLEASFQTRFKQLAVQLDALQNLSADTKVTLKQDMALFES